MESCETYDTRIAPLLIENILFEDVFSIRAHGLRPFNREDLHGVVHSMNEILVDLQWKD